MHVFNEYRVKLEIVSSRRLANSFNRECASKDEISEDPMLVGTCIDRISMETLAWKSVPS